MSKIRANTFKKYDAFIRECQAAKTFSFHDMRKKYKVDGSLLSALKDAEAVVPVGNGVYNWIHNFPIYDEWVDIVIQKHQAKIEEYKKNREARKLGQQQAGASDQLPEITEQQAIALLKSMGYEIYKVERKQL
jgi:hypothetical protein